MKSSLLTSTILHTDPFHLVSFASTKVMSTVVATAHQEVTQMGSLLRLLCSAMMRQLRAVAISCYDCLVPSALVFPELKPGSKEHCPWDGAPFIAPVWFRRKELCVRIRPVLFCQNRASQLQMPGQCIHRVYGGSHLFSSPLKMSILAR